MERLSIESLIVDENELAEHYKEAGNEYGYKGKSKLVEYLKELKTYKDAEEQRLLVKIECRCKDCVHWSDSVAGATEHVKLCTVGGYMVGENGYCVYAEQALKHMGE